MAVCARIALVLVALLIGALPLRADLPAESPGQVEKLPPPQPHWIWVADLVLERLALVDLDSERFLGLVNGGYGPMSPQFGVKRGEMYLASTYFSRRVRGTRTDVLEIYDIATLSPVAEVILPSKRATDAVALAHTAISDDERFVAVFNWTPATSLSIVDVEQRKLTAEVAIPGCSLVYAAGDRRFFALCADGSALVITLNDDGSEASKVRTQPFFDPLKDPVTEKAARYGDQWIFASFGGRAYGVEVGGEELKFLAPWSLLNNEDRRAQWRIGGLQHLAVHEKTGRLYSLVHRGGADTHKEPGDEIWIYDLKAHSREQRIELVNPGITVYGFPISPGWPFGGLFNWAVNTFAPAAVTHIAVTQDDAALLLTASQFSGAVGVYDARSGDFVKRVQPVGWTSDVMFAPLERAGAMSVTIDPAVQIALRAALSLLFAWAAVHKLRDVSSFKNAVENYALLPRNMTTAVSLAVIGAEIAIALALPAPVAGAALAAAALLALYTLAITINLARGRRDIDCGCSGPTQRRPLSRELIWRNAGLCGAALVAALPASARTLMWIDAGTITATIAFLCLLYAALDGIASNAPRLALRRPEIDQTLIAEARQ